MTMHKKIRLEHIIFNPQKIPNTFSLKMNGARSFLQPSKLWHKSRMDSSLDIHIVWRIIQVYMVFIVGIFFSSSSLIATTYGSSTTVTQFTSQVINYDGDLINKFALLSGGMQFASSFITVTFASTFPVGSNIALNGGTIILNRDLTCADNSTLQNSGNIIGNNHALNMGKSQTVYPGVVSSCAGTNVASLALNPTLLFFYNYAEWSADGNYLLLDSGAGASVVNVFSIIQYVPPTTLQFITSSTGFTSNGTALPHWRPNYPYQFSLLYEQSNGAILFETWSFNPSSGNASIINYVSTPNTVNYSGKWHPTGNYFAFVDTVQINLYPISPAGNIGTPIIVPLNGSSYPSTFSMDFSYSGSYIAVARGNDHAVLIFSFNDQPTLSLTLTTSTVISANQNYSVNWNPTAQYQQLLALGDTSGYICSFDPIGKTLTQIATFPGSGTPMTALWAPNGTCIYTTAPGSSALLTTFFFNPLTNSTTNVGTIDAGRVAGSVLVNPTLNRAAVASSSPVSLRLSAFNQVAQSGCFTWSNLIWNLPADLILNSFCTTFTGYCVINANNNTISLTPSSSFLIGVNSTLYIKNAIIKYLQKNQIAGIDPTSTLSLENVKFELSGAYTFSLGTMDIVGNVDFVSNATTQTIFGYSSNQPLILEPFSRCFFDANVTFSYGPTLGGATGISFVDTSAQLAFRESSLVATNTLLLLKGTIFVDGLSSIVATGTANGTYIQLGDGLAPNNNLNLHVYPAANLILGGVVHSNV